VCGILGMAWPHDGKSSLDREACNEALALLRHRGPDANGQYQAGRVWLGHVRLSILDLSDLGRQPMSTQDGACTISYNGEVYNYRKISRDLGLGDLRSTSDTEVVLRAFSKCGSDAFAMLDGMFALAIYDARKSKLWLARDRFGIKPLYFRADAHGLAFGSEIKAVTALDRRPSTCDLRSIHEWLYYGNTLGERTPYQGIRQLLPGHFLELDLDTFRLRIAEYWSLQHQISVTSAERAPPADAIVTTRNLLEQAVQGQLVSDVPVGVFLSGGVDSSAITAFAARHYGGRLATYSAGFDFDVDNDELPKARRIAALYGTDHHEIRVTSEHMDSVVEKMVHHHDTPFSDAANIPLYLLASALSGRVKVVLQGDGSDELFGGYRRYATVRYWHLARPLARLGSFLSSKWPHSVGEQRIRRYCGALAQKDAALMMALLLTVEQPVQCPETIFSAEVRSAIGQADPFARYREIQGRFAGLDIANQMSMVDMSIVLPDLFLEKVDRSTMAGSIEVRVPFLDQKLANYVAGLTGGEKMPWGRKKWLLKKALAGIVPDDILYGPKVGLTVPYGRWLRAALRPFFFDQLATFVRRHAGVLDESVLRTLYADHDAGRRDNSFMLWKAMNFMVWCNDSRRNVSLSTV
jgi:asparagine synthase (glutamine-hydrolysing)